MAEIIPDYLKVCSASNKTVALYCDTASVSLEEFIGTQTAKVLANNKITSVKNPDDFYRLTSQYVKNRLGEHAAAEVYKALQLGVINTADHHGGFFSAQTFQGDLLFTEVLRKLGYEGSFCPLHAGGQVELGNATYGRGLAAYTAQDSRSFFPLYSSRDRQRLTSHTRAVDRQLLDAFYKRVRSARTDKKTADAICDLIHYMYDDAEILSFSRFGDQIPGAGKRLCDSIFEGDDHPVLTYIELEEVVRPLIIKDLYDDGSLLYSLISDQQLRHNLNTVKTDNEVPLSELLFRNADHKGRKSLLTLTEDGFLVGKDWHKNTLCYKADPESIAELLESRQIFPGLFTIAILIAMERAVTWMGGVFQSVYLCDWQSKLVKVLELSGMSKEAALFASYDCSACICGPMFALYGGENFAAAAGAFEFYLKKPAWSRIRKMMRDTDLRDSHLIGLSELYYDLVPPGMRDDNWYSNITGELISRFPANLI